MPDRWPFADAKSLAVITLKRIVKGRAPVLYVVRDDEGGWQFLDGDDCTEDDAAIVGLDEIIAHDPTLRELAALPPGFYAARETLDAPWHIGWRGDEDDGDPAHEPPR